MTNHHGQHRPRKRFGQNFLHDRQVIGQIVQEFEVDKRQAVVEIGPGRGALTGELLKQAAQVHAIEIDRDLAGHLQTAYAEQANLHLHRADALRFDFSTIHPQPLQIIGNLPYNISTPLLFYLLQYRRIIRHMVLMLQDEVVDRICAAAGSASYGRLSVMVQSSCSVEKLFQVAPSAFRPEPAVNSAIVRIQPKRQTENVNCQTRVFENLVRQAFGQRRKTLRKALAGIADGEDLASLGIASDKRPGELTVDEYIAIAERIQGKNAESSSCG